MTNIPPLNILVTEDEKTVALHICKQLEKSGHVTQQASNGDEALKALSNRHFDLVFMDIQMPVMDGLEATRKIRNAEDAFSSIPIIGLSSEQSPPADEDCKKAGMTHFLSKPFSIHNFEQAFWQMKSQDVFSSPSSL